jgi:hypothetical protein
MIERSAVAPLRRAVARLAAALAIRERRAPEDRWASVCLFTRPWFASSLGRAQHREKPDPCSSSQRRLTRLFTSLRAIALHFVKTAETGKVAVRRTPGGMSCGFRAGEHRICLPARTVSTPHAAPDIGLPLVPVLTPGVSLAPPWPAAKPPAIDTPCVAGGHKRQGTAAPAPQGVTLPACGTVPPRPRARRATQCASRSRILHASPSPCSSCV